MEKKMGKWILWPAATELYKYTDIYISDAHLKYIIFHREQTKNYSFCVRNSMSINSPPSTISLSLFFSSSQLEKIFGELR